MRRKNKKSMFRKTITGITAVLLAMMLSVGLASQRVSRAYGAEKTTDVDTTEKYVESLGDGNSTEYSGRIWTDKTVKPTGENGIGDFEVTYSALATSQELFRTVTASQDVVFIIDISGSMVNENSGMTDGDGKTYTRMKYTIDALNRSIDTLMQNEHSRFAVVAFSTNATTLLELGHYQKMDDKTEYFRLSETKPSTSYPTLYVACKNNSNIIHREVEVSGGTNIQKGVYTGMNILATANDTDERAPVVVLLSDGAPTYSVSDASWWAPKGNDTNGSGSNPYYGNGMKAMMTATYMKAAIDRKYVNHVPQFYTIGMGITGLSGTERNLANITLNPSAYWDANNSISNSIRNAWSATGGLQNSRGYATRGGLNNTYGTPFVEVGRDKTYQLTHPGAYDIVDIGIKNYVDGYYSANQADDVNKVLEKIVNLISISTPDVPTRVEGDDPLNSGYITYTDPVGQYMEVKGNSMTVEYRGSRYTLVKGKSETKEGETIVEYVCENSEATVETYLYGTQPLSALKTILTEEEDGKQTVMVKIPAALIPLRINTVVLDANGKVKSHTNNQASPVRVLYHVGLKDGLKNDKGALDITPNMAEINQNAYETYIGQNIDDNGNVSFYSNRYTGRMMDGNTVGDAAAEFTAATTNPFYYMQEDTPIYIDAPCTQKATELNDGATYYCQEIYYHGLKTETVAVSCTAKQLKENAELKKDAGGHLYCPKGTVRVDRMLQFRGGKTDNSTKTAQAFYFPSHVGDGTFQAYLGNNGCLKLRCTGNLTISKTVTADAGLIAPDKAFKFTVTLKDAAGNQLQDAYHYTVTEKNGNLVGSGSIYHGGTLSLKGGQTVKIINLPQGTQYTVTETAVDGFCTKVNGEESSARKASGTIKAGQIRTATFENRYSVTPLTFPTEGKLGGEKVLEGRTWNADDTFTFAISSLNQAPLPEKTKVTVNGKDTEGTANPVAFSFGTIQYTTPGTYAYKIVEVTPGQDEATRLPGVSYTKEAYQIVVTVTDKGDGTLQASSVMTKIMNAAGRTICEEVRDHKAVFTNTFSAQSTAYGPVATKNYTDDSGANPLADEMFTFTMTPVDDAPMPEGTVGGVYTTYNQGVHVSFGQVKFTQSDVGKTYVYRLKEAMPREANAGNHYTHQGVTYDPSVIEVSVKVGLDGDKVKVTPTYTKDGQQIATGEFTNIYKSIGTLEGATNLKVKKVLEGRDWMDDDAFTFTLIAAENYGDNVKMPALTKITITKNDQGYEKAFGNIVFTKGGTYKFEIAEKAEGAATGNVTYDNHKVTVTVVVTDDGKGQLQAATPTYEGSMTFKNIYTPDPIPVTLTGTKRMSGRDLKDTDVFDFTISAAEGCENAPMPNKRTVQNTADGTIVFPTITYHQIGTYQYVIRETGGEVAGVTNDTGTVNVTVVVGYDSAKGVYNSTVTYAKDSENLGKKFTFTNVYTAGKTDAISINATKTVSVPDEGPVFTMQGGEFSFQITPSPNNPKSDPVREKTVLNDANGDIDLLSGVTYTEAGTYIYGVREQSGTIAGVTYDDTAYEITVKVSDDALGKLQTEVVITKDEVGVESISFTNYYNPPGTHAMIAGKKVLEGKDIEAGEFTFKMIETSRPEGATASLAPEGVAATNTAWGTFHFPAINYTDPETQVGTYTYKITEVNGRKEGYTYDSNPQYVTVKVETDEDRNMTADVSGMDDLVFHNQYQPTPVTLQGDTALRGTKMLEGREMNEGEFAFQLTDQSGNVILEAVNAADGSFNLEPLTFEKAGNYYYTLSEKSTGLGGVTYDTVTYTVEIHVTDAGGHLEAVTKYYRDGQETTPVFHNTYAAENPAVVQLGVTKRLKGRALKDGEFTFVLKNEDGNVISTAKNNAGGVILFEEMTFGKDMEGVYQYTISEEKGNVKHVTYDDAVYQVTITVKDSLKGYMEAVVEYEEDNPVFTNIYKEPVKETPEETPKDQPTQQTAQTGDQTDILPIVVAMVSAFGVMVAVLWKMLCMKRRKRS